MRYVRLGRGGLRISAIGLGLWQAGSPLWHARDPMTLKGIKKGLERAVEFGINFFDTAEVYGGGSSEEILGETFGNCDDVIITTKVADFRTSEDSIIKAAETSRRRLKRDVIDLVLYHWPPPIYVSLCKVIRCLEKLVDRGVARYIGVSNFSAPLLKKAVECLRKYELVSNQVQYSLAYRVIENNLKPLMEELGVGLVAWSPLAKGALAGRKQPSSRAERSDKVFRKAIEDLELQRVLGRVAERRGATRAQVALAWLMARGAVPIPGFRRPERVEENAGAAEIRLGDSDLKLLDEASAKYIGAYGRNYPGNRGLRFIPAVLQMTAVRFLGGL